MRNERADRLSFLGHLHDRVLGRRDSDLLLPQLQLIQVRHR